MSGSLPIQCGCPFLKALNSATLFTVGLRLGLGSRKDMSAVRDRRATSVFESREERRIGIHLDTSRKQTNVTLQKS